MRERGCLYRPDNRVLSEPCHGADAVRFPGKRRPLPHHQVRCAPTLKCYLFKRERKTQLLISLPYDLPCLMRSPCRGYS